MVFQNYALFPHMTVAENLSVPAVRCARWQGGAGGQGQARAGHGRAGAFGGRRPAQLSGGQQQRVAVARALVFEPELVLMDEPLGALDKQLREQMQYEIKHIHENLGVTVVYVTHDQTEALTMSDRVAVFNDGIIQQLSTPDELYERPQNSRSWRSSSARTTSCAAPCRRSAATTTDHGQSQSRGARGTHLHRRPYPRSHERRRQRRVHRQGSQPRREARLTVGETVQVGWALNDCKALDAVA
jgi:putative spermidine/putrescine transport system ATP-binding protein